MFPTVRMDAPLPLNSRSSRPLFSNADVERFVDTYEVPAVLRDPISQRLMTRPVAFHEGLGPPLNVCVDESTMRWTSAPDGHRRRPEPAYDFLAGVQLQLHAPMQSQVLSFVQASVYQARLRHGPNSDRFHTLFALFDAIAVQSNMPLGTWASEADRRRAVEDVIAATSRAMEASQEVQRRIDRLLAQLAAPDDVLLSLEASRRALVTEHLALRDQVRALQRTRRQILLPLMGHDPESLRRLCELQNDLWATQLFHDTQLRLNIPAALRSRAIQELRTNPAANPPMPPSPPTTPRSR